MPGATNSAARLLSLLGRQDEPRVPVVRSRPRPVSPSTVDGLAHELTILRGLKHTLDEFGDFTLVLASLSFLSMGFAPDKRLRRVKISGTAAPERRVRTRCEAERRQALVARFFST